MKNMKRMFSALTALALGSTAAVSVVACGNDEPTIPRVTMSDNLLKMLGLLDASGKPTLKIELELLNSKDKELTWVLKWSGATSPTAENFLDKELKALNPEAKEFLTGTLGLTADENGKFNSTAVRNIEMNFDDIKPNLIPNANKTGYTFTEGTVNAAWYKKNVSEKTYTKIVNVDGIKLKEWTDKFCAIKGDNPYWHDYTWEHNILPDFDTSSEDSLLNKFAIDTEVTKEVKDKLENKNITGLLKTETEESSEGLIFMKRLIEFANDLGLGEVKITTTKLTHGNTEKEIMEGEKLAGGDKLNFSISIGEVTYPDKAFIIPTPPEEPEE